jgi:methyl-accepting chemotaxis protein
VALTTWLARALVVAAVVGLVASLVLIQRFGRTYGDALEIAAQSALLVGDSESAVQLLADDVSELTVIIVDVLSETRSLLATTRETVAGLGVAAETNLALTADGAASIADRLAGIIEQIERFIPGDTQSAAEELRAAAEGLEPTADQLRELGAQLQLAADQLEDADEVVGELAVRFQATADDIDSIDPVLEQLATTATTLEDRAVEASNRLGTDLWLLRFLAIMSSAIVAAIGVIVDRLVKALARPGGVAVQS